MMSPVNGTVVDIQPNGMVGIMLPTTQVMYVHTDLPLQFGDKLKVTVNFVKKQIGCILEYKFDKTLRLTQPEKTEEIERTIVDSPDDFIED